LPDVEGDKPAKKKFKAYPIGFFHIYIAEVRTEEGKLYLFAAIDRTSKFAFVRLEDTATVHSASTFLKALIEAVPYKIRTVLTDNGVQFCDQPSRRNGPTARLRVHMFDKTCREQEIEHRPTKPNQPWTIRPSRANEPNNQAGHCQTVPLREPRPVAPPPRRLPRRLQFRTPAQNPQGPHALRVHLQGVDNRAQTIQARASPSNAGPKQLGQPLALERPLNGWTLPHPVAMVEHAGERGRIDAVALHPQSMVKR
jgi:hypothetical protein